MPEVMRKVEKKISDVIRPKKSTTDDTIQAEKRKYGIGMHDKNSTRCVLCFKDKDPCGTHDHKETSALRCKDCMRHGEGICGSRQ